MAESTTCHLLALPREIRNMIYELLTVTDEISPPKHGEIDKNDPPLLQLWTKSPAMLRTSTQIRAEYMEQTAGKSILQVIMRGSFTYGTLEFKKGITTALLRDVGHFDISIDWFMFLRKSDREKVVEFLRHMHLSRSPEQKHLRWTPTKGTCTRMKRILQNLEALLHPNAKGGIIVHLDGYPGLSDPQPLAPIPEVLPNLNRAVLEGLKPVVHVPTLLDFLMDETIAWPEPGTLGIAFQVCTPLYCHHASNATEVKETAIAYRAGLVDSLVLPECEVSKATVTWLLRPSEEAPNFCGFFPVFLSVSAES